MTIDTIQALRAANCDDTLIAQYSRLEQKGRSDDCARLLRCHRSKLVDAMHEAQRPIDVIDWVIAELER